jgi:hypothetical protein
LPLSRGREGRLRAREDPGGGVGGGESSSGAESKATDEDVTQMLMAMMPASSYKTPEKRAAGLRKGLDDASSALPLASPGHIECALI